MNLKLALSIIEPMESDSETFDFIKFINYDEEVCEKVIPMMEDLDVLDELVNHCFYRSQYAFRLAFQRLREIEKKEKENSKLPIKVCA